MADIQGLPNPVATDNEEAYLAMLAGIEGLKMPEIIANNKEFYLRLIASNIGRVAIKISGCVSDVSELPADPEVGDAYGVGSETPFDVYIYGKDGEWHNFGPIQGPKGEKGDKGPKGDPGAVTSVNGKTGDVVLTADDIDVKNSQSIQDNLERIDGEIEDIIDNKQDVTLMVSIVDEDNMTIDSTSSEIYEALSNGRAVNLAGMNLSLVEYRDDSDELSASTYYGIGGYNFTIHENQITDMIEVEFENLNNKDYTLSSSSDKYPSSSAVKTYVDEAISNKDGGAS